MNKTVKLFFALPLKVKDAERLSRWREDQFDCNDAQLTATENFHVTLAFIGAVDHSRIQTIIEQVNQSDFTAIKPFSWLVDSLGFFSGGIVYAGGRKTPMAMTQLQSQLKIFDNSHLAHKVFTPHITLFRNHENCTDAVPMFELKFDSFGLFESRSTKNGVKYHAVHQWLL